MWYLDCFCHASNPAGKSFPVNSYFHESAERLASIGADLLQKKIAGIDEIRISKGTLGQCPIHASKLGNE